LTASRGVAELQASRWMANQNHKANHQSINSLSQYSPENAEKLSVDLSTIHATPAIQISIACIAMKN